jgi:hypothetical protein
MIDDMDGYLPAALILFTWTTLSDAVLEWQQNKGVHQKAPKAKLKVDRTDRANHFNY